MSQSSSNRVEKFENDRRKGRDEMRNKTDNRKKGKTKRGKDRWSEDPIV